eukprot:7631120-Pyramimonas_sp.AAC.1
MERSKGEGGVGQTDVCANVPLKSPKALERRGQHYLAMNRTSVALATSFQEKTANVLTRRRNRRVCAHTPGALIGDREELCK